MTESRTANCDSLKKNCLPMELPTWFSKKCQICWNKFACQSDVSKFSTYFGTYFHWQRYSCFFLSNNCETNKSNLIKLNFPYAFYHTLSREMLRTSNNNAKDFSTKNQPRIQKKCNTNNRAGDHQWLVHSTELELL